MKNKKITILIVCRGNIVRSPVAEKIIKQELRARKLIGMFEVFSKGIQGTVIDPTPVKFPNITFYDEILPFAKEWLIKNNINLSKHVSGSVSRRIIDKSNLIIAMDLKTKYSLTKLFPYAKSKIIKLSEIINSEINFEDPEEIRNKERCERILDNIQRTILTGFPKLLALANTVKKT